MNPEDLNASKPKLELDRDKLNKKEFQELWKRINTKTAYDIIWTKNPEVVFLIKEFIVHDMYLIDVEEKNCPIKRQSFPNISLLIEYGE